MVGPRSPEEGYSSEVWVEVCRQQKNCSFRYAVQGKKPYFMTLIRFVLRTELGKKRLSLIIRVNVVLNRTVVLDSD